MLPPAATVATAVAAESLGFDVVWIDDSHPASPTVVAASLAVDTTGIRVGLTASVGTDHPIELAEEVTVADLALGGRLALAVRPVAGAADDLPEILDLLQECFASHPFRHPGPRWPAPANLEQNVFNLEDRIRVTPSPAQLELPLWVAGRFGREAAAERGLGILTDVDESADELAVWWDDLAVRQPAVLRRIRRNATWEPPMRDGRVDVDVAVDHLRTLQRSIGLDLVVACGRGDGSDLAVMADLSRFVRPLVQLDRLPPGLVEHWAAHRELDLERPEHSDTQPSNTIL